VWCEAICEKDPSERVLAMFQSFAQGIPPEGSDLEELRGWRCLDPEGKIAEGHNAPLRHLPNAMQDFLHKTLDQIYDYSSRTVSTVRWKLDRPQGPTPISWDLFWDGFSFDKVTWFSLPSMMGAGEWRRINYTAIPDLLAGEIRDFVQGGGGEPLAHALFREAWALKDSNRRSSLLMGIVAAEVGFKHYASQLAPDTRWLMEELPSPPLEKMLRDFFPRIPAKNRFGGRDPHVPMAIQEQLKKGVTVRNKVTHRGEDALSHASLKEVLLAVKDLLWLLDFHSGSGWALAHVRPETLRVDDPPGTGAKKGKPPKKT
jgi:hypothetical protein